MINDIQKIAEIQQELSRKKLALKFVPELESHFRLDYFNRYHNARMVWLFVGIAMYFFGFITDSFFPYEMYMRFFIKFVLTMPCILILYMLLLKVRSHVVSQILTALIMIFVMTGLILCGYYSPAVLQRAYFYSLFIVFIFLSAPTYVCFSYSNCVLLYSVIVFNISLFFNGQLSLVEIFIIGLYLYVSGAIMTLMANYGAEKLRRNTYLRESLVELQAKQHEFMAKHDPLTNLANRSLFNTALSREISICKRNGTQLALIYLDLDDFKAINDNYGHNFGDILLKQFANKLINLFHVEDYIARVGGDEFLILLNRITSIYGVTAIAKRIISLLDEGFLLKSIEAKVTASIGISLYPVNAKTPEELIKQADLAMYRAKKHGKNNFQFYKKNIDQQYRRQLQIATALQFALKRNEFELVYQPIIDPRDNSIAGMESLLRWHPNFLPGISPAEFIPILESLGLIREVGLWVIDTGLQCYRKWKESKKNLGYITFNVSALQLTSKTIASDIARITKKNGVSPEFIGIEITESALMANPEMAQNFVNALSKLKYKIIIDDFGTGYSSFERLKDLKVDVIKIDKVFVDDVVENYNTQQIIRAIFGLAKNLNFSVVAEGVENEQQKDFLLENGCTRIQGYFYSRPLEVSKMEDFIMQKDDKIAD